MPRGIPSIHSSAMNNDAPFGASQHEPHLGGTKDGDDCPRPVVLRAQQQWGQHTRVSADEAARRSRHRQMGKRALYIAPASVSWLPPSPARTLKFVRARTHASSPG